MLQKLLIKNIALIDNAEINFTKGLNVLSGETGAGKSVIIESLNFVLGAKADKSLIRSGENECLVRAEFDVSNNAVISEVFASFDMEIADELIVSRKFTVDGKSSIKINGESVTVSMLRKFTSALIDVHGQSEHFHLLKAANQLALIDKFAGEDALAIKEKLSVIYNDYKNILKEIDGLGGDETSRELRLGVLDYQIKEIEDADIKEGEEQELIDLRQTLKNKEKIISALSAVKNAIMGDGGVDDVVSSAERALINISSLNAEYSALADKLSSVISEIDDVADVASNLIEGLSDNDLDADAIEERLDVIKKLKRKYGDSFAEITAFLDNAIKEKEKLEKFNETAEKLLIDKKNNEEKLFLLYNKLSSLRQNAAKQFASNVLSELCEVGINKAKFLVEFADLPNINECKFDSANGFDGVEFMFSANLGEPLKPLSNVISGGEMSRFMLAIKAQTAKYNEISTFIFDEIDAGISGNIAKVVSEKFAKIAKDVQIIAITHLPQIAAMSDNALFIEKIEIGEKTVTTVKSLTADEKIKEIVRLIGGDLSSSSAMEHAKELLENAENYKKSI